MLHLVKYRARGNRKFSVFNQFFDTETKLDRYMSNGPSIGMDHVLSKAFYKGIILQRNYRIMTMKWSFSYKCFIKLNGK